MITKDYLRQVARESWYDGIHPKESIFKMILRTIRIWLANYHMKRYLAIADKIKGE